MLHLRHLPWVATIVATIASPVVHAGQATFPVVFDASSSALTPPERNAITSHVQAAGAAWAALFDFDGTRTITVRISIDANLPTANGTSLASTSVGTLAGRVTYQQGAASELASCEDPNGDATPDVAFTMGLAYLRNELWFDPDPVARSATVPSDRTDAMSLFLHEFGHAFAYNGWSNGQGVPPAGYWSTFDRWMQSGSPTRFTGPQAIAALPGSSLDLTTNNIHHWGNSSARPATTWIPTRAVEWFDGAPRPWAVCEGVISIDAPPSRDASGAEAFSLPPLLAELMNGVVFYRGVRYDISALDLGVLRDLGLPAFALDGVHRSGFESGCSTP